MTQNEFSLDFPYGFHAWVKIDRLLYRRKRCESENECCMTDKADLEASFALWLRQNPDIPEPTTEYRFHPPRQMALGFLLVGRDGSRGNRGATLGQGRPSPTGARLCCRLRKARDRFVGRVVGLPRARPVDSRGRTCYLAAQGHGVLEGVVAIPWESDIATLRGDCLMGSKVRDAIYDVLQYKGKAMRRKDVLKAVLAMGVEIGGHHPMNSLATQMGQDARFAYFGVGWWGLKEWQA